MPFIRMVLWIALLVSAMLLPFLPGRHDPLAMSVSAAATVVAFGGLLLVSIGVAWLMSSRGYALTVCGGYPAAARVLRVVRPGASWVEAVPLRLK